MVKLGGYGMEVERKRGGGGQDWVRMWGERGWGWSWGSLGEHQLLASFGEVGRAVPLTAPPPHTHTGK